MPYANEHAARLRSPDQYDRFRRENDKFGSGIHAIWGIKDSQVDLQAIRFDASTFTVAEAKAWLKDHDYHPILFEPASGGKGADGTILNRAYSLITIKAVNDEQRIIEGLATSPVPDRLGDIIEPLGVTFKNPVSLHLYHDTTKPVGLVRFKKPTAEGVEFTASLPVIPEPGTVRDRVNEAWDSVKARLLRGVSIGFRVLNDAVDFMKDTGGYRYRETEILELSLISVPAHQLATINVIKALDAQQCAASGLAARIPSTPSGVADPLKSHRMKNASEQLGACKQSLQEKTKRLEAIQASAEAEVLSESLTQESATLVTEVKGLRGEIDRLSEMEASQAIFAKPVLVKTFTDGSSDRSVAHVGAVEVKSTLQPGMEFARLLICKMAAYMSGGGPMHALEMAKQHYPDNPRIHTILKAAVAAATTTDATWAGPLVIAQTIYTEFIDFLRPQTILGKFGTGAYPSLNRVPFNVRILGETSGGSGYWVGQAHPKPLTKWDLAAVTLGFAKVANIAAFSDELARFSNPAAEGLIRNGLAKALIQRMDIDFVDPNKAIDANVSPASITNGIAGLVSSGTDADAVRADLAQLFQAFIAANNPVDQGVFIMSQTMALALSLMRNGLGQKEFPDITMKGGSLEGLPVITSQYCALGSPAAHLVILLNADDIYLSDDGQVSVDVSREASLEMDDAPGGSPSSSGASMISLWQSNLIGLRAERYINWQRRRDTAVAWIDNVAWGTGSP